jgi:hypothetical protein
MQAHTIPQGLAQAPPPVYAPVVPVPPLGRGPLALVEALLKSPASIIAETREPSGTTSRGNTGFGMVARLSGVVFVTVALVGLVMSLFSGGLQVVIVPIKLTLGVFACALLCLPSLHVFSCLSGASQRIKDTFIALLLGIALMSVLLVGFAPIAWIFAQATSSAAVMGGVHLVFLVISCALGLGLVKRALSAMNGAPVRVGLWSPLFLLVVLQMTTTLRPLVGPADDAIIHGRSFFLGHWVSSVLDPRTETHE